MSFKFTGLRVKYKPFLFQFAKLDILHVYFFMLFFLHSFPRKGDFMKKRIVFLILFLLGSISFTQNVWAKKFTEERTANNEFDIYTPSTRVHIIKTFTKITDEEGDPLYELSPKISFFSKLNYTEKESSFNVETLQKFSKIMYFGYGYKNHNTDAYYFATQYLLYQVFEGISTTYKQNDVESDHLQNEINEIERNIQNVTFTISDFTTSKNIFEITDSYVVDNFTVKGDNIDVSYEEDKMILTFLNEKEQYKLTFVPKNICKNTTIWTDMNIILMERREICEQEYPVVVTIKKEETKEEHPKQEEPKQDDTDSDESNQEEKEQEDNNFQQNSNKVNSKNDTTQDTKNDSNQEEMIEVEVPNTSKSSFSFPTIILLLGTMYYVYKK